jgi:hypothetical protein
MRSQDSADIFCAGPERKSRRGFSLLNSSFFRAQILVQALCQKHELDDLRSLEGDNLQELDEECHSVHQIFDEKERVENNIGKVETILLQSSRTKKGTIVISSSGEDHNLPDKYSCDADICIDQQDSFDLTIPAPISKAEDQGIPPIEGSTDKITINATENEHKAARVFFDSFNIIKGPTISGAFKSSSFHTTTKINKGYMSEDIDKYLSYLTPENTADSSAAYLERCHTAGNEKRRRSFPEDRKTKKIATGDRNEARSLTEHLEAKLSDVQKCLAYINTDSSSTLVISEHSEMLSRSGEATLTESNDTPIVKKNIMELTITAADDDSNELRFAFTEDSDIIDDTKVLRFGLTEDSDIGGSEDDRETNRQIDDVEGESDMSHQVDDSEDESETSHPIDDNTEDESGTTRPIDDNSEDESETSHLIDDSEDESETSHLIDDSEDESEPTEGEVREDCEIAENRGDGSTQDRAEVRDTDASSDEEVLDRYGVDVIQLQESSDEESVECSLGRYDVEEEHFREASVETRTIKEPPEEEPAECSWNRKEVEEVKQSYVAEPAEFSWDRYGVEELAIKESHVPEQNECSMGRYGFAELQIKASSLKQTIECGPDRYVVEVIPIDDDSSPPFIEVTHIEESTRKEEEREDCPMDRSLHFLRSTRVNSGQELESDIYLHHLNKKEVELIKEPELETWGDPCNRMDGEGCSIMAYGMLEDHIHLFLSVPVYC